MVNCWVLIEEGREIVNFMTPYQKWYPTQKMLGSQAEMSFSIKLTTLIDAE